MPEPAVDRLSRAIGNRLAWLFLISAILTCYEVVMDAVFRAPTIWVHDTTLMMSATCFLFGGAYAMQRRDHIRHRVRLGVGGDDRQAALTP